MSSPASHRAVIALAAIVIVAFGLRLAGAVILPVLTALFIAIVSVPILRTLERARVPRVPATILTLVLDALVLAAIVALDLTSMSGLRAALPRYGAAFDALEHDVLSRLADAGIRAGAVGLDRLLETVELGSVVGAVLSEVTEIVSNVLLVVLLVGFLLFELGAFERKLEILLGSHESLERVARAARRVQRYLVVKTAISLLVGALVWLCLTVIGVDFPVFWALVTFLLNFVPTIGPAIAVVPSTLVALLTLGPGSAAAALASQLAVHLVVGNVLEPRVMGETLGISTLVVVVSMVFWGWLWGPVGALFAVPLTRVLVSLLELSPDTRWLALLLSSHDGAEEKMLAWGWKNTEGVSPDSGATAPAPALVEPSLDAAPVGPASSSSPAGEAAPGATPPGARDAA